jgi:hemerythrin-like metal-binding protein
MSMQWSESLELNLEPMDETHKEFVDCYNAMAAAGAETLLARLDDFIRHCDEHFGQENRWMEVIKFPSCHRAEHDRVMNVLHEVRQRLEKGDGFYVKQLIQEIPTWFENHAATMDAALAYTLKGAGFDFETESLPAGVAASAASGCGTAACGDVAPSDKASASA